VEGIGTHWGLFYRLTALERAWVARAERSDEMLAYNPVTEWTGRGLVNNVRDW
jgi:hypothetical protein